MTCYDLVPFGNKSHLVLWYIWSCYSVNRRHDLSGAFKFVWILSWWTYCGANRGKPSSPVGWNRLPLTPPPLFDEIRYPPPSFEVHTTSKTSLPLTSVLDPLRWKRVTPCLMNHGYHIACSTGYREKEPFECDLHHRGFLSFETYLKLSLNMKVLQQVKYISKDLSGFLLN